MSMSQPSWFWVNATLAVCTVIQLSFAVIQQIFTAMV